MSVSDLPQFFDRAVADKQLESTPHEAYRRVLWVLKNRCAEIEQAILGSRKRGDRSIEAASAFFDLSAARLQVLEDIQVVEMLLRRLDGLRVVDRPESPTRDPRKGYGER